MGDNSLEGGIIVMGITVMAITIKNVRVMNERSGVPKETPME
jgi:hypothetical protein